MRKSVYILATLLLLSACGGKQNNNASVSEETLEQTDTAANHHQKKLDEALFEATMQSDEDGLKEMIKKGANLNSRRWRWGETVLHYAVRWNESEIVNALIAAGADVNARDNDGYTPLDWAHAYKAFGCEEPLLEKGAEFGDAYQILRAASSGSITKIRELLDKGENINVVDRNGCSVLHYTVLNCTDHLRNPPKLDPEGMKRVLLDNIRELIEKGANPNTSRDSKYGGYEGTPLHDAARKNMTEIVEILLEAGADIEADVRHRLNTPLIDAVENGHKEMTSFLLDKGADVSARVFGCTALHVAVEKGGKEVVKLLLAKDAEVNLEDRKGKTPLDYAETEEMKELLRRYGAETSKELREEDK
jgi:ankyrin repeat protein